MGMTCCNCDRAIGEGTKVQSTTVTPADGKGADEHWCPRCFVAKRMHEEPGRFNASQTCVVNCRACGHEVVSFGALPRRANRCSRCQANAGKKIKLAELPITPRDAKAFVEAAHAAGATVAVSK